MKNYQYQIVRYLHDQVTGEFVNVGIVLYEPDTDTLLCRFISKFSRVSGFFSEVNGHFLLATLKHFEKKIAEAATNPPSLVENEMTEYGLSALTSRILPADDSALQLTDVKRGIDVDPNAALEDLFDRLVDRYNVESSEQHNDSRTWKTVYKKYFDKYGVTSKLKEHAVKTENDLIQFDKAWKNGVWNCYQTLALDLKREDAIKNKIYKWSGILKGLESATEDLNLYFLTSSPRSEYAGLKEFVDNMLTTKNENIKVAIVDEKEAERFAAHVKEQMKKSHLL